MMPIGDRPVLWHVMRYYAHFGHKEFILCLGYGAHGGQGLLPQLRRDRLRTTSSSARAASESSCLETDISDWTITFVDTGIDTAIGERLRRVRQYLEDDEIFLANYGDVLTDAPMNDLIDEFSATDAAARCWRSSRRTPSTSSASERRRPRHRLTAGAPTWTSGSTAGYFILRQEIFDYLDEGDDLVMDACVRAAADGRSGSRPSATTASGRRWTRSRSAPPSRTCTATGKQPVDAVAR